MADAAVLPGFRIVVADAFPLVRAGIRTALAPLPMIEIVAEAEGLSDVRKAILLHHPELALVGMDFEIHPASDSIRRLVTEHPDVRFVLLPSITDDSKNEIALRAGVKGIYPKSRPLDRLPNCVCEVRDGGLWFDRALTARVLGSLLAQNDGGDHAPGWAGLTSRERRIIAHVCKGDRNKQIAAAVHLSEATVAHHLTSVYRKLSVSDRTELILFAQRHGLVRP